MPRFPVYDISVLDTRAKTTWKLNEALCDARPGDLVVSKLDRATTYLRPWPDAVPEDCKHVTMTWDVTSSSEWAEMMVPVASGSVLLVLWSAHDAYGNLWCLVCCDAYVGFIQSTYVDAVARQQDALCTSAAP